MLYVLVLDKPCVPDQVNNTAATAVVFEYFGVRLTACTYSSLQRVLVADWSKILQGV